MSKKLEKNVPALSALPYLNSNRLEEAETKILHDKNFIEKLKEEVYSLKKELNQKDKQYV
jgi:hypothetical protein